MRIGTPQGPFEFRPRTHGVQPGDPTRPVAAEAEITSNAQPNTRNTTRAVQQVVSNTTVGGTTPGGGGDCTCSPDLADATGVLGLIHGGTGVAAISDIDLVDRLGIPGEWVYVIEIIAPAAPSSSSSSLSSASSSVSSSSASGVSSASGSLSSISSGAP